jgi:UDP-GlcNAc:undecaprenyl-phosphate GlcNAc-1-phosphate transferase
VIVYLMIAAVFVSLAISLLATPLSRRVAVRTGMIDVPQRHKAHARPTPLLGGSAIFGAFLGPALLAVALARYWDSQGVPAWLTTYLPELARHVAGAAAKAPMALGVLGGAALMHVLGLIDDRKPLGPFVKLAVQTAVAVGVVVGLDVRVLTVLSEPLSTVLSVLWLVAITNALNFMDNMDGLSAGVAAICCTALMAASLSVGQVFVPAMLALVLGATLGYLPYNFPTASTFMGDAGSLVLGYMLGVASMLTTYVDGASVHHYSVLAPLVLLAVPLYDMISVIVLRLRQRVNPLAGDRRHFSHRLVRRGMSTRKAVLTVYLCTAETALAAVLLPHVDAAGSALVLAQTVGILLIVALLESTDAKAA